LLAGGSYHPDCTGGASGVDVSETQITVKFNPMLKSNFSWFGIYGLNTPLDQPLDWEYAIKGTDVLTFPRTAAMVGTLKVLFGCADNYTKMSDNKFVFNAPSSYGGTANALNSFRIGYDVMNPLRPKNVPDYNDASLHVTVTSGAGFQLVDGTLVALTNTTATLTATAEVGTCFVDLELYEKGAPYGGDGRLIYKGDTNQLKGSLTFEVAAGNRFFPWFYPRNSPAGVTPQMTCNPAGEAGWATLGNARTKVFKK